MIEMMTLEWKSPSTVQVCREAMVVQQARTLPLEADRPGFEPQLGFVLVVWP